MSALFFPACVCVCVYTEVAQEAPLISKWMTTVIAWHITGSHKSTGWPLCESGAGREEAQALSAARLWMWDASVVRHKKPQSGWFSGKWYNIYSWHSGGSWLRSCGVTSNMYISSPVVSRGLAAGEPLTHCSRAAFLEGTCGIFSYHRGAFSCCFHIWIAHCGC